MKAIVVFTSLVVLVACAEERAGSPSSTAPQSPPIAARIDGGVQTVDLKIRGADYAPAAFSVKPGIPVRLNVTRDDKPGCGDVLLIPAHKIKQTIPLNQTTTVEFTPQKPGDLEFTCGMNMMRGKIIVQGGV